MDVPITFEHVWKRYRIGSKHDSLRDAIPRLFKGGAGRNGQSLHTGEFWAIQDVTFEVKRAETVGIIGPNGAGKSTVLKLLSKICKQTKGKIQVIGRLAALIEVGAGFHPDLTGSENITLNGTIMGLRRKEIERLFDSIVEFSELKDFLEMPLKRYSSGMAVRLGFAVAAHVNPEVLLIDEVLAVGDLVFQQKCYQRLQDLKAAGTTIVFISHNLEAVQRLCDRVVLLDKGLLVQEGEPAEVIASYRNKVLQTYRAKMRLPHGNVIEARSLEEVAFTHASLTDASGNTSDAFSTGDTVRLLLSYHAKRSIEQPRIVVTIERLDGLVCHTTSTAHAVDAFNIPEGDGSLVLEYDALNLLPNTYRIQAALFERNNPVPLSVSSYQLYLTLTSDSPEIGAVHLDHHWNTKAVPAR